jgi:hypothetical protein
VPVQALVRERVPVRVPVRERERALARVPVLVWELAQVQAAFRPSAA